MKIVVASSGLGHIARGIEAWAQDLGHALAQRGLEVTLCKGGGEIRTPYERVISCWQRGEDRTRRLLRWLPARLTWRFGMASGYGVEQTTFALRLVEYLRQEQVDILHLQDPQVALIVQRARNAGWIHARTILAHGTDETPEFLRKFTYLQHLAPWHLQEARFAGAWQATWTAIPNFIDSNRFVPGRDRGLRAELGIPPEALVLLSVAAIKRKHKRVDYLLGEFATLRQRRPDLPVWLVVAGGCDDSSDELMAEGRRLLGERVRFLASFPRQRMPDLYRAADLFALCSLKEMMPMALLEAMASGLPSLVHRQPVMQWMIGTGGMALDMQRPGALAEAAGELLTDGARRRALSENGRRYCLQNFATRQVVDEILNYYEFVMAHRRSAGAVGGALEGGSRLYRRAG